MNPKLVLPIRNKTPDIGSEGTGWYGIVILDFENEIEFISSYSYTKSNIFRVCQKISEEYA